MLRRTWGGARDSGVSGGTFPLSGTVVAQGEGREGFSLPDGGAQGVSPAGDVSTSDGVARTVADAEDGAETGDDAPRSPRHPESLTGYLL